MGILISLDPVSCVFNCCLAGTWRPLIAIEYLLPSTGNKKSPRDGVAGGLSFGRIGRVVNRGAEY
jgi:hypothetical protein